MTDPSGPKESLSLAAKASTASDSHPVDPAQLHLALIDTALENGATWAQIGRVQGISGREAKKRAHWLRTEVGRARRMQENRGEEAE